MQKNCELPPSFPFELLLPFATVVQKAATNIFSPPLLLVHHVCIFPIKTVFLKNWPITLFKRFSVKTAPLNGGRFFGEGAGAGSKILL